MHTSFKNNIWSADVADMLLIINLIKEFIFLLCVIDIAIKYAWIVPLKDKKGIATTNAFQKILDDPSHKPSKIWLDKGGEF